MPFQSKAQQSWMKINKPHLWKKWRREHPNQNLKNLPKRKKQEIIIEAVQEEAKDLKKEAAEAIRDEKVSGITLPENVEKLVNFMKDTGGSVEDYVTLNKDYTKYDDKLLVKDIIKKKKKLDHILNDEEVSFINGR